MKKISLILLLLSTALFAKPSNVDFSLNNVPLPNALNFIYTQILQRPFILAPSLINDKRLVSFHVSQQQNITKFFRRYLANLNICISSQHGVDYIQTCPVNKQTFVYYPKYRSVSYLSSVLQSVVTSGTFTNSVHTVAYDKDTTNSDSKQGVINNNTANNSDVLVYLGTKSDMAKIKALLPKIDTPPLQVTVSAFVVEVQTTQHNGSGLELIANLFKSHFGISIGSQPTNPSNFITFSGGGLQAFYQLIKNNSHFKVVSNPRLTVLNGQSGTFSVGQEVPVLGSVSYQDNKPVQSIEYRDSGVIFTLAPHIYNQVIDLNINQEISNFIPTTTGVSDSPTLTKRQVQTDVALKDGQILMLGGLAESKNSDNKTGFWFLPDWFSSKSKDSDKTDIVVILQVHLNKP